MQKEQYQEGGYKLDAPNECYNLFLRKYENIEVVTIRNEWCGWGNVNKKNVYMLDYNRLKTKIECDSQICIF